jgi:hypothetical protein
MSDLRKFPDGDESSMLTFNTSELCDVLLGQPKNDIEELDDYDESELSERKRSREINEDEASLFTLNTTMEFNVSSEPVDDQDGISAYGVSEYPERPRVKEEKLEVRNVLEMRVQNKRETSRSKYKCGKCGQEKKHHICAVDQVRAGRRWPKQNVWTQTPTQRMEEGGSDWVEVLPFDSTWTLNKVPLHRDNQTTVHPDDVVWIVWYFKYLSEKYVTTSKYKETSLEKDEDMAG